MVFKQAVYTESGGAGSRLLSGTLAASMPLRNINQRCRL